MKKTGAFLKNIVPSALPWYVARRLPPQELLLAWPQLVGSYLARRATPVSLNEDGLLVLAVQGASLRQELSLITQDLLAKLENFKVTAIKIITSRPPARKDALKELATPPPLEAQATAKLAGLARGVGNPRLRDALLAMLGATEDGDSD